MSDIRRRRLLEMTVGARFSPALSLPLPSLPSLYPLSVHHSSYVPLPPLFYSFPFPCPCPLNQSRRSGELSKLLERVRAEAGRLTLLMHFQAEINAPHSHNDTFVFLWCTVWLCTTPARKIDSFYWFKNLRSQNSRGGDLGSLPRQLFGCGGDRPHGVGAYGYFQLHFGPN